MFFPLGQGVASLGPLVWRGSSFSTSTSEMRFFPMATGSLDDGKGPEFLSGVGMHGRTYVLLAGSKVIFVHPANSLGFLGHSQERQSLLQKYYIGEQQHVEQSQKM